MKSRPFKLLYNVNMNENIDVTKVLSISILSWFNHPTFYKQNTYFCGK